MADSGLEKRGGGATPTKDVNKIKEGLKSALQRNHSLLQGATENSLGNIAAELFAKDIITEKTNREPSYQKIIDEFKLQLKLADSLEKLQELCQNFLHAIASQGGPAKTIADRLTEEWKKEGI